MNNTILLFGDYTSAAELRGDMKYFLQSFISSVSFEHSEFLEVCDQGVFQLHLSGVPAPL